MVILIVEDVPEIRRLLRACLQGEGYHVVECDSGRRAVIDAGTHKPDMAIIDLGLPDLDGVEVIRQIRTWSPMPIIVLSARIQEQAKIQALDAGADDYITKPFAIGEMLARLRVAMRHIGRRMDGHLTLNMGTVALNLGSRTAIRDGQMLHLTPIEFRLLLVLARHLGMVVTHRQLLTEVWGPSHVADTHYLRIYMKQLRDKLEDDPVRPRFLHTEIGIGYRLTQGEEAPSA